MDENLNINNKEVSEALKEINLNQQTIEKKQATIDSDDAARKVQDALREFELQQKKMPNQPPRESAGNRIESTKIDESLNFNVTSEIEESLKKFEEKSALEQQKKVGKKNPNISEGASAMEKLVMKISGGLVKDKRQASFVLLIFALLTFLTSGYFFYISGNTPIAQSATPSMLNNPK